MMLLDEYQEQAGATAFYPGSGLLEALCYLGLKLNGEAGEVGEKIGKALRDMQSGTGDPIDEMPHEWIEGLAKELGDVLWYVAMIAKELGFGLECIAEANLLKLGDRKRRGQLGGSGDDR